MPKELSDTTRIYKITNKDTGKKSYQPALTPEDACKQAGWLIADCFVMVQKLRLKPQRRKDPLVLCRVPCQICPFQYAECRKPEDKGCPVHWGAPELQEWLNQVGKAHLCDYVGQDLLQRDYKLSQKWITVDELVNERSSKH